MGLLGLAGLAGRGALSAEEGTSGASNRTKSSISACSRRESACGADSAARCREGIGDRLVPTGALRRGRFRRGTPASGRESCPAIFSYTAVG